MAACDEGCCAIPTENVPLFVAHLILALLATTCWILCAAILHAGWASHLQAWVAFQLALAVVDTWFGVWGAVVDARDATFYERSTKTFLAVDGMLIAAHVGTAVTGAVYWRAGRGGGADSDDEVFDSAVVVSWLVLGVLAVIAAQDRLKEVSISPDICRKISQVCSELNVDGLRGDIVTNRASKAFCAFDGRTEVTEDDVKKVITLCLRHRLRKDVLESMDSGDKVLKTYSAVFEE